MKKIFIEAEIKQIPKEENLLVDGLVKMTLKEEVT